MTPPRSRPPSIRHRSPPSQPISTQGCGGSWWDRATPPFAGRSLDLPPCRSLHSAGACHHRTRTPEPKAPRGIASRSAKPVLCNDIDKWVLRCALVVPPPTLDDDLGLAQSGEDFAVEQLVAQASVEALDVAVLPGAASLDVGGLGTDNRDPFLHCLGEELRSVVGPDVSGNALQDEEVGQNVDHIDRLELAGDTDRQAFMGELVEHVEHPVLASLVGAVLDKVVGPDMIALLRPQPNARSVGQPQPAALGLLMGNLQPLTLPDTLDPLVVDCPARLAQQRG